jgi:hypothetical protein
MTAGGPRHGLISRADGEALFARVEEALAAGHARAPVEFAGMTLEFEKAADGRMVVRAPGQPVGMAVFLPQESRSRHYPAGVPFVRNEGVTVSETAGTLSLVWWSAGDPKSVVRKLSEASLREGWTPEPNGDGPAPPMRQVYANGQLRRFIMLSSGIVTLIQKEQGAAA